jgi:hypothetical protein
LKIDVHDLGTLWRPAWQESCNRRIRKLLPFGTVNTTAPKGTLGISHVSNPPAVSRKIQFSRRDSRKKGRELLRPALITDQFTAA